MQLSHRPDDGGSKDLQTSLNFYQTTRGNIHTDSQVHSDRRENLKYQSFRTYSGAVTWNFMPLQQVSFKCIMLGERLNGAFQDPHLCSLLKFPRWIIMYKWYLFYHAGQTASYCSRSIKVMLFSHNVTLETWSRCWMDWPEAMSCLVLAFFTPVPWLELKLQ